jgi:hypothetical protein
MIRQTIRMTRNRPPAQRQATLAAPEAPWVAATAAADVVEFVMLVLLAVHPTAFRVKFRCPAGFLTCGSTFSPRLPGGPKSVQWLGCDGIHRLQLRGQLGTWDLWLSRPAPYSRLIPSGFARHGEP